MKTRLIFSKTSGTIEQKRLQSVSEFTRMFAVNTVSGDLSYLRTFLISKDLDVNCMEKKTEKESNKEFIERKLKEQRINFNLSDEQIKETESFKIFSSKNKMFEICRNYLPCFFVQSDEDIKNGKNGKLIFAKEKCIALRYSDLSEEKKKEIKESKKYVLESVNVNIDDLNDVINYFVLKDYSGKINLAKRLQRINIFGERKKSGIFYTKNGNIYTLIENDKITLKELFSVISFDLQIQEQIKKKQAEEAKEKEERVKKQAEHEQKKRNEENEVKTKAENLLNKEKQNGNDLRSLNKCLNDFCDLQKHITLQPETLILIEKIKNLLNK